MVWISVWLLFLHGLADFWCQNRWMADNKSKSMEALTLHVFVYSLVLWFGVLCTGQYGLNDVCRFAVVTFAGHWLTDAVTSRLTKKALAAKNMHVFFGVIGTDQFVHTASLLLTAHYLLGR